MKQQVIEKIQLAATVLAFTVIPFSAWIVQRTYAAESKVSVQEQKLSDHDDAQIQEFRHIAQSLKRLEEKIDGLDEFLRRR